MLKVNNSESGSRPPHLSSGAKKLTGPRQKTNEEDSKNKQNGLRIDIECISNNPLLFHLKSADPIAKGSSFSNRKKPRNHP